MALAFLVERLADQLLGCGDRQRRPLAAQLAQRRAARLLRFAGGGGAHGGGVLLGGGMDLTRHLLGALGRFAHLLVGVGLRPAENRLGLFLGVGAGLGSHAGVFQPLS